MLKRARGCMMGQLTGDALGSQVEFMNANRIRKHYPDGVRVITGGGSWETIPGQPTDDSEMALALARSIIAQKGYSAKAVRQAYRNWLASEPFDCGNTVRTSLHGACDPYSQANGALMRISPLAIYGVGKDPEELAQWAREDAALTHVHTVCGDVNAVFCVGVAQCITSGCGPEEAYEFMVEYARQQNASESVLDAMAAAKQDKPVCDAQYKGWVLVAWQNALWQLLHAPTFEDGVVDTVMQGGDTDTNAAICGALLGAVYGIDAVPQQWSSAVLACRPRAKDKSVFLPRPEIYWPVDALNLAEQLLVL